MVHPPLKQSYLPARLSANGLTTYPTVSASIISPLDGALKVTFATDSNNSGVPTPVSVLPATGRDPSDQCSRWDSNPHATQDTAF